MKRRTDVAMRGLQSTYVVMRGLQCTDVMMGGLQRTDVVMRCLMIRHTEYVLKKMRSSITSRWVGTPKLYAVVTVNRQITAKIDVTISVLLTVTPVVPKDPNLSTVILMRMCIEDVAKKRVPHTLILNSPIAYILKNIELQELIGFYIQNIHNLKIGIININNSRKKT